MDSTSSGTTSATEPDSALISMRRASSVLDVSHIQAGQRVRLRGRLDVHTVADVRAELRVAVAHGVGELVVDLGDVELGDTTGLGVLLGVHRRAVRAGRTLVLVGVSPALQRLLVATRLARVLHVRDEVALPA